MHITRFFIGILAVCGAAIGVGQTKIQYDFTSKSFQSVITGAPATSLPSTIQAAPGDTIEVEVPANATGKKYSITAYDMGDPIKPKSIGAVTDAAAKPFSFVVAKSGSYSVEVLDTTNATSPSRLLLVKIATDVGPINSEGVKIYTQLAAGFAYTNASHRDYFTTQQPGGSFKIMATDSKDTVSTALTGLVSIAYQLHPTSHKKLAFLDVNAIGFTFGSGIQGSTSGTFQVAPFIGGSLFFGDNDSVALTIGLQWVPENVLKGHSVGDIITTDQFSTTNAYRGGKFFIGLSYRIGGSGSSEAASGSPTTKAASG